MKVKIKEPQVLPKAPTKKETAQLLQSAYEILAQASAVTYAQLEKTRDVAVIELLFATAARVSEIDNFICRSLWHP